MKLLCIGDLHGKNCWKQIDLTKYDKIVFLGDYVDCESIDNEIQISNLSDIVNLKRNNPEKIVLILGNHDIHYSEFPKYQCRGFNADIQPTLTELFNSNLDQFCVAYQKENWLFTHAGLTNKYFHHIMECSAMEFKAKEKNIADLLNAMHNEPNAQGKLHLISYLRGGPFEFGGITWADSQETLTDFLIGFHQVVGHTRTPDFQYYSNSRNDDEAASITYIDVLDTLTKFHEVEIS